MSPNLIRKVTQYTLKISLKNMYSLLSTCNEPPHDKTNKMACAPSEDSDQPGHPHSLIRFFTVCMKKHWFLSYLLSHSKDSDQTGHRKPRLICLHWAHMPFCWFWHEAAQILSPHYCCVACVRQVTEWVSTCMSEVFILRRFTIFSK